MRGQRQAAGRRQRGDRLQESVSAHGCLLDVGPFRCCAAELSIALSRETPNVRTNPQALASAANGRASAVATPQALPLDGQSILELAARSMFELFSSVSQGMFLVDRPARIVWINEGYKRFLPALGFSSVDQFVGHLVDDVVPNTQMRRVLETGQADPDRPADQPGRHLRRQPHPAARRRRATS